jgi:hypothetical protein
VKDGTYKQWATNSYNLFVSSAVPGTPTGFLNGKELSAAQLADPTQLNQLVAQATSSS